MAKNNVEHIPNIPVYRNTWKNQNGYIRTNLYVTQERAVASAVNNKLGYYQEIATPVFPEQCFLQVPEMF